MSCIILKLNANIDLKNTDEAVESWNKNYKKIQNNNNNNIVRKNQKVKWLIGYEIVLCINMDRNINSVYLYTYYLYDCLCL